MSKTDSSNFKPYFAKALYVNAAVWSYDEQKDENIKVCFIYNNDIVLVLSKSKHPKFQNDYVVILANNLCGEIHIDTVEKIFDV